jgi:hypothetical protein
MMNDSAGTMGAVFAALYAAHTLGDHWIQTDHQAAHKALPGRAGWVADLGHVATLTLTQVLALAGLAVIGVHLSAGQVTAGLAVNAVTHAWADRRHTLARLAELVPGKANFYRLGTPRAGHDDAPHIGTGAYALDQSFHIGWLFVAALIIAA